ncbi:TlpA disulfide reductase family protein [Olivibacter sp. XZL3]|uniref:TlpA family protein disulfide reductase n=1 Tax=Olivibacter sp. XZL3 TaxID=1735116 RepID=UPI001066A24B|nr:TlpA disulfide reductase family protein [Olivibacter sp. XZL3]
MQTTIIFTLISLSIFLFTWCTSRVPSDTCRIILSTKNYPIDSIKVVWFKDKTIKEEIIHLKDGSGEIDIKVPELTSLHLMSFDDSKSIAVGSGAFPAPAFPFFAENGKQVRICFDNDQWPEAAISGGEENTKYGSLWKEVGPLERRRFELLRSEVNALGDQEKITKIAKDYAETQQKVQALEEAFIINNPSKGVSLWLLEKQFFASPITEFEKRFLSLADAVRASPKGKEIQQRIAVMKKAVPGQPAPDFVKKDKDGNTISLSQLKGKYVLLDFWGTWCMPCREGHPHLVELHKKYNADIEFINVAQERIANPRKAWLAAIEKDKLTWTQILNNENEAQSNIVELYNIEAFPTKILIDKDGIIIGRYTADTKKLDEKLKTIFNK